MNHILSPKYQNTVITIFLCLLTVGVYWPVKNYPFINFDDGGYVFENTHVQNGISFQNIIWAFSPSASGNNEKNDQVDYWHPLTWISHMIDCQLFGLNPHLHHLSNLFFHVLNTLLLYLAFVQMTGSTWKSFIVAILFALHPINVDSTAWIAERKNLLSTSFWMITMLTYIQYVRRPSVLKYILVFIAMALGLLAKPMLVTLPCVLLLLDYWPLGRMNWNKYPGSIKPNQSANIFSQPTFSSVTVTRLVLEKIPLLIVSIVAIILSMEMLHGRSQVLNKAAVPMLVRIENAFVSYVAYLYKTILPQRLAVFYPFPEMIPLWKTIGAILLLAAITAFVLLKLRQKPYFAVGWFWYLGVLFPVIGFVQGGLWPALADRWAYVPLIGIFIMVAWGIPDYVPQWRLRNNLLTAAATVLVLTLFLTTRIQLGYWQDTLTLFRHALAVTENNFMAYDIIGMELVKRGDRKEAEEYFLKAIKIKPDRIDALRKLGDLAARQKDYETALRYYNDALMYAVSDVEIMRDIADTLCLAGRIEEAMKYYSDALIIKPYDPQTHNNLGNAHFAKGDFDQAEKEFQTAIALNPQYPNASYNLGLIALKRGKTSEAIDWYKKTLKIDADYVDAHTSLADILFSQGDSAQAMTHYLEALRIRPDDAKCNYNIGVILLAQNHRDGAAKYFQKALKINPNYEKAKNALILMKNATQAPN